MGNMSVLIKQRVRTIIFVALASAVALTGLLGSQSYAQTPGSNNVLKISPLRTDIQVAAGSSKTVQITITNPTSSEISITPIENDFTSGDENGTPAVILDANTFAPTHSLKRFMAPLSPIVIPVGQSKTITVTINVPASAQAGGYFGAIRFTPTTAGSGGQVNLSASAASLILLTVPGPTVEKLNLTDFLVQQKGITGSFFSTPTDLTTFLRFENKGNIQDAPFGNIAVKQNGKVVYETDFNITQPRDVVLPDGARRWDVPLKDIGTFGYFTVTATLTYGTNNSTIEVSRSFWVVPTLYIILGIAGVVLLIAIIIFIILMIRRSRHRRSRGGYRR